MQSSCASNKNSHLLHEKNSECQDSKYSLTRTFSCFDDGKHSWHGRDVRTHGCSTPIAATSKATATDEINASYQARVWGVVLKNSRSVDPDKNGGAVAG